MNLLPCPFCGESLLVFGHEKYKGRVIKIYIHPKVDGDDGYPVCPLYGLVFREPQWQSRPIEDALRAEIERMEKVVSAVISFVDGDDDENNWSKLVIAIREYQEQNKKKETNE